MSRHARGGFVLPFVLLALTASALVVLANGTDALRALRGAEGAAAAARVQLETESALAIAVASWTSDSVASWPLGTARSRSVVSSGGLLITQRWIRTAPNIAWLTVSAQAPSRAGVGVPFAQLTRVVWLEPPALPVTAALSSTGPLAYGPGTVVLAPTASPDSTSCSREPAAFVGDHVQLAPASLPAALTTDWSGLIARAASAPLVPSDSSQPRWRAAFLRPADSLLVGPLTWHGLLLHDGALRLVGDVTVHGLLIVRGTLDAEAARLTVHGAVVVVDGGHVSTRLGNRSLLRWDRCAVEMALATVATPRSRPFFAWQAVTP